MNRYALIPCLITAFTAACSGQVLDVDAGDDSAPDSDWGTGGEYVSSGGQAWGIGGQASGVGGYAVGGTGGQSPEYRVPAVPNGGSLRYRGTMETPSYNAGVPPEPVQITFTQLQHGAVVGSIVIGAGAAPEVDPTQAYPQATLPVSTLSTELIHGFHYSLSNASLDGTELAFDVEFGEAYVAWCVAQPVFAQPPGTARAFGCIPWVASGLECSGGDYDACVGSNGASDITMGWGVWAMCGANICTCAANGCSATSFLGINFNLSFDNDSLVGTVNGEEQVIFERF